MSLRGLFLEIAEAIREREGSDALIPAADFPERIRSLSGGSGIELQSLSIVTPPEKTQYYYNCFAGEKFRPEGLALEVAVGDGGRSFSFPVGAADISFEPAGALPPETGTVTVIFSLGGEALSAEQAVSVLHRAPSWAELELACASWEALMAFIGSWEELEEM